MSKRWQALSDIVRSHMRSPLTAANPAAIKAVLRDFCQFNETSPLDVSSALPAQLNVMIVKGSSKGLVEAPPAAQQQTKVPIHLWSAVLPWENARGLSKTPLSTLMPSKLTSHAEHLAGTAPAPVGNKSNVAEIDDDPLGVVTPIQATSHANYPSASEITDERGMLFVQEDVDHRRPASFWSGAITGPIDIAFLQLCDPYVNVRRELSQAAKAVKKDIKYPEFSLVAEETELVVADYSCLEPFPANDTTRDTPYAALYGDLYGKSAKAKRTTEAMSRVASVVAIMETRRYFLRDHVQDAVAKSASSGGKTSILLSLDLSEQLHEEIQEKRRLLRNFVFPLENEIRKVLREWHTAIIAEDGDDGPTQQESRQQSDKSAFVSRDAFADVPAAPVTTTLVGRQGGNPVAGNNEFASKSSAVMASRHSRTQPGMVRFPPVDYELLVLSYKLGLCCWDIADKAERIMSDLRNGNASDGDVGFLLHLTDPSLIVADEIKNAVKRAAAERNITLARPLW